MEGLPTETYLNYLHNLFSRSDIIKDHFVKAIKDSHALVAGGSVLRAYKQWYDSGDGDIDIYVNINQAELLYDRLKKIGYSINVKNLAPAYDQSFFMKNNISARFRLINYERHMKLAKFIDIMLVPSEINLTTIVQNFDLTCCEIWFDGTIIRATNNDDILNSKGTLREEYRQSLLEYFNNFIIKRMKKYTERGFTITYECEGEKTVTKPKKTIQTPERWVVATLYNKLLSYDATYNGQYSKERYFRMFCRNNLEGTYTMSKLKDVIMNYTVPNVRCTNDEELKALYTRIFTFPSSQYENRCLIIQTINNESPEYMEYITNFTTIPFIQFENMCDNINYEFSHYFRSYRDRRPPQEFEEYVEIIRPAGIPVVEPVVLPLFRLHINEGISHLVNLFLNSRSPETLLEIKNKIYEWYGLPGSLPENFLYILNSLSNAYSEKNDFVFETFIVDENLLRDKNCFDVSMVDEVELTRYLADEEDGFMFVIVDQNEISSVVCYKKEYIINSLIDFGSSIFYECTVQGRYIDYDNDLVIEGINLGNARSHFQKPYMKLPIIGGGNALVPLYQILKMIETDRRIFYLFRQDARLRWTVSHDVSYDGGSWVSAKHCQDGSDEPVYNIKICGGDNCVVGGPAAALVAAE